MNSRGIRGAGGGDEMGGGSSTTVSRPQYSQWYVLYVLFQVNFASMSALFINKAIFAMYHFHFPVTLYLVQAFTTLLVLLPMYAFGMMPDVRLSRSAMIALVPCALVSWLNVVVGLLALTRVNIPMFSALRRLTVLFTLGSEMIMMGKVPSPAIAGTVVLLAIGSVMSALSDVTFSAFGYLMVFLNNVLTAINLVLVRRTLDQVAKLSPLVLSLYMFSYNSVPCFLIWIASGEAHAVTKLVLADPTYRSPGFFFAMMLSACSAFFITFATTLSTGVTSPLSTTVSAQLKNLLQSIFGMFSWGYVPNPTNVTGIMISAVSQVLFAAIKFRENQRQNARGAVAVSTAESDDKDRMSSSGSANALVVKTGSSAVAGSSPQPN